MNVRDCWCVMLLAALAAVPADAEDSITRVLFSRDIRLILSDNCFPCHGPDAATRESDPRLDGRESVMGQGGENGVIVPGDPDGSPLYERIVSEDPLHRMLPDGSGLSLTSEEKELMRRWIAEGADYQEHWSFVTPERPLSFPRCGIPLGPGILSTILCWRGWNRRGRAPRPRPSERL